tara:strand:+ start:1601 stop:1846 length:246 start_codon:yes stop_codon:yes gene_type:complete
LLLKQKPFNNKPLADFFSNIKNWDSQVICIIEIKNETQISKIQSQTNLKDQRYNNQKINRVIISLAIELLKFGIWFRPTAL